MDQATDGFFSLEHGESSVVSDMRDQDTLSRGLRLGLFRGMDDIARLISHVPTAYDTISSESSTTTTVFTSRDNSTLTRPTSISTSRPFIKHKHSGKGKDKLKVRYASSLSGTHGSASEAEAERRKVRRNDLLAMGAWTPDTVTTDDFSEVSTDNKRPRQPLVRPELKKQKIALSMPLLGGSRAQLHRPRTYSSPQAGYYTFNNTPSLSSSTTITENSLHLTEQGLSHASSVNIIDSEAFSRARAITLVSLLTLKSLVLAVSIFCAFSVGKGRRSCTKAIVLAATVVMGCLTIITMRIARREVSEALLAGLIEFIFGFSILIELDDLM